MSRRAHHLIPFRRAFVYWLRLGFINFGGPAGQIAIMHDDLVEKRRWIGNDRFLHALNYCMLLPGPEATQLAIYIGWLLNGFWGGMAAGILFILPAFFLILALSWTYVTHGDIGWVAAIFHGLEAAVVAIVAVAVIRLGKKALKDRLSLVVAVGAFIALFLVKVPFPFAIGAAAAIGLASSRRSESGAALEIEEGERTALLDDRVGDERDHGGWQRSARVLVVGVLAWLGPLGAVVAVRGWSDTLSKLAAFFSQAAMVTFGGAYAVLAYIDQAAVERFGWLERGQMITGLGLAESTPGPLIMVTEFVGFLAAYRYPGDLDPVVAGTLGAVVTIWATFAPCFLWIFLGAPYIERLRGNRALNSALGAITAAVVGVVANLAVTFAIAALFSDVSRGRIAGISYPVPDVSSLDAFVLAVAVVSAFGLWYFRWNVLWVVAGSAAAGLAYTAVT